MKKKHENRILLEGKGDKLEESKSSFMKEKGGSKYKERPITDHRKGKGSLMKGSPFQRNKVEEGQRIQELMAQLQENNDTILYQKLEIKRLKENISELVAMQQFATPKGYPTNGYYIYIYIYRNESRIENEWEYPNDGQWKWPCRTKSECPKKH